LSQSLCSRENCDGIPIGYLPAEKDTCLCDVHFDEATHRGLFTCFLDEIVCPNCEGRSALSSKIKCVMCRSEGVVKKEQPKKVCRTCKGKGFTNPPGRPWDSEKQSQTAA
jgi:hypothetical protein